MGALKGGLRELGWIEGQSIAFEERYQAGKPELLPDLAADLVRGSHALAAGARCGAGGQVDAATGAADGRPESVDTSLAGFAGGWPHRPGGRTVTPAALR